MRIDKIITTALSLSSIANGTRSLGHQNRGRELEQKPYVENWEGIDLLPDGIHPQNVPHSKHNNVMTTDQTSRLLDEMQVDDPRPIYSAQKSKKINVEFSKYLEGEKARDKANYQLVEKESEFVKLLKKYITEKPAEINLLKSYHEQSEELCKELLLVRNDLKNFVVETKQKLKSLEKYLKNDEIENRTEAEEYEFRYKMDLDNLKNKKREANSFLANCRELTRFLKDEINYLRTHSGSTSKTTISMPEITNKPTTAIPTLSPQEESIAIRFEDLSNNFNMATKNIKYLREQISELHSQLRSNKKISPSDIQQTEKNLNILRISSFQH